MDDTTPPSNEIEISLNDSRNKASHLPLIIGGVLCVLLFLGLLGFAGLSYAKHNMATLGPFVFMNEIAFPDKSFNSYVSEAVDSNSNGVLSPAEQDACTFIDVSNKAISDLSGIEYFKSLTELACDGSQVVSVDLARNTALTTLSFANTPLKYCDLSKNTNLSMVNLLNTDVTSLDVTNCTAIESLLCDEDVEFIGIEEAGLYSEDLMTSVQCLGDSPKFEPFQKLQITYDDLGRMVKVDSFQDSYDITYDDQGRLASIGQVVYSYKDNSVERIYSPSHESSEANSASATFDENGKLISSTEVLGKVPALAGSVRFAHETAYEYTYDEDGELSEISGTHACGIPQNGLTSIEEQCLITHDGGTYYNYTGFRTDDPSVSWNSTHEFHADEHGFNAEKPYDYGFAYDNYGYGAAYNSDGYISRFNNIIFFELNPHHYIKQVIWKGQEPLNDKLVLNCEYVTHVYSATVKGAKKNQPLITVTEDVHLNIGANPYILWERNNGPIKSVVPVFLDPIGKAKLATGEFPLTIVNGVSFDEINPEKH